MVVSGVRPRLSMGVAGRRDRGSHRRCHRRHPHRSARMNSSLEDWRAHAAALAEQLTRQGAITDPAWHDVVAAVPRHVFVPEFYSDDDPPELISIDDPRWLGLVYSDETLVTQRREHPEQPGFAWSTSSSTRPSLMLRMLHMLDVLD